MADRVVRSGLSVAEPIRAFVEDRALPGTGIERDAFWDGVAALIADLAPRNRELLEIRDEMQTAIDDYHRSQPGPPDPETYRQLLVDIGYLVPAPTDVAITTASVDREISEQCGPQLVVPLLNRRFAANAVNARWGSLYDALYGTDAIDRAGELAPGRAYNPRRGAAVVAEARAFLDLAAALDSGSHADAMGYAVDNGRLAVRLADGSVVGLADESAFLGYRGLPARPEAIVLTHHGLGVEIVIDPSSPVGAADPAGVSDLIIESAVTTIMDLEDSVAAVNADDKALGYDNWRELMLGTLAETVTKDGVTFERSMNPDRDFLRPDGTPATLPGRSLLFVRNVGHLMTTDAVLTPNGDEVPEGILDAVMTALGFLHDGRGPRGLRNSAAGSLYVVKPKMHGPDEVAFAVEVFRRVEDLLGLPSGAIKIGIMDEERRTSANLAACVAAASDRLAFINTGFLDRTGDEIHTSMHAGPMVRKAEMKAEPWIAAYEASNVDVGLAAGLPHRAQIGKGMWAMPDLMRSMLDEKIAHPRAGATTAWVPSPTAATLHALHYHQVDVFAVQEALASRPAVDLADLLTLPLARRDYTAVEVQDELDNNLQSILGYVVRWVDLGIGCSKVPDIHDVALMEDRATCRISSQHVANWLLHGIVSADQVEDTLRRMARVVDEQNATDPLYRPMGPGFDGPGFQAARALVLDGVRQPSGYTEPILHRYRRELIESPLATGATR